MKKLKIVKKVKICSAEIFTIIRIFTIFISYFFSGDHIDYFDYFDHLEAEMFNFLNFLTLLFFAEMGLIGLLSQTSPKYLLIISDISPIQMGVIYDIRRRRDEHKAEKRRT